MGKCIYLRKGETHTKPIPSILAASLNIGDVVKLNEGGVETEFIVVNQGLPDGSLYDISCNGTWLLRKDIKENRVWDGNSNNTYSTSAINTWLNGDYFNSLGSVEQDLVKQVKIPYVNGTGSGGSIASGSNGLSVRAFLLGGYEVGWTTSDNQYFPQDGAKLSYFESGESTSANNKRIANLNGSATHWWLRSPKNNNASSVWFVDTSGVYSYTSASYSYSYGVRPALIIPFTAKFNSETKVLVGGGNSLPYLMFTSPESFTLSVNNATKNWDGTLQYSTDTTNWAEWDGTTTLSSVGNRLYLRGVGNSVITGGRTTTNKRWAFSGSNIGCNGNIENLLDYQTVSAGEHPVMAASCYENLFRECSSLIVAPNLLAVALSAFCYNGMFSRCTALTNVPALPATTLADACYGGMFNTCTSLITLPNLPASVLVVDCYASMFASCSKIKLSATQTGTYTQEYRIPISGTGTTASSVLSNMFYNTGGTFTGTPEINTTYYLDSSNYIV